MKDLRSMDHLDLREVAQLHDLGQKLERRSNNSLTCNNSSQNSNDQTWVQPSVRRSVEERVGVCSWVLAYVRGLADITEKEAGECVAEPTELDGSSRESSKVSE